MTGANPLAEAEEYPRLTGLLVLGVLTGLLSGLFGIGGGVFLVPALVMFLGMPQRRAAGTSVSAILPSAIVGATTYGIQGNIDWIAALCLAVGVTAGAVFGAKLLVRLPVLFLQILFMTFVLFVVVSLWIVIPQRTDSIDMGIVTAIFLLITGLVTGVISGLVGVGGGVIIVPALMFFFGASDLIAKGTSLLMMIPGSISGTITNARNLNVNIRAAVVIGIVGAAMSPVGTIIAAQITPGVSNALFSILLGIILIQMLITMIRKRRR